ncbi:MAG: aminotransferase class I/II-fold pyridoxal phosphate-dependent enzyme [Candidatus Aminicenantes bacterium]|nr:aminotransferase class I/II-fold pyridoxal phosphate-dependent enzyme [Candidatus Aminicenantes bacterium]
MKIEPFALERFFAEHEFGARHLLCASDCETFAVKELLALEPGAEKAFAALRLGYTETAGHPDLRAGIAALYSGIAADDVLVFSGAEEAIFLFMHAVLRAGDHVIVPSPCYQSLEAVAVAAGCRVSRWETSAASGWQPDIEHLRRDIVPATRAVVVNFPHNPSGHLPSAERFAQVVDVARDKRLLLFSDEVYRFLEYDAGARLPAACEVYENGVSLGVMSKAFGLAGLRLGWVACRNRSVLRAMAELKDYTTICAAAPSEFLARLALRHRDRILARNLDIIRRNLQCLDDFFSRHGRLFSWHRPQAGPIAFPAVRFAESSDGFCANLLQEHGVLLAPGRLFGAAPEHFRLGFGRVDFGRGLEVVSEHVARKFD